MTRDQVILEAIDLHKSHPMNDTTVVALKGVSLQIRRGDYLAITGQSGSGKTTLLHLLGGLDSPTRGKVILNGQDLAHLNGSKLAALRLQQLGFVFQRFHLLPVLTAAENVELPMAEIGVSRSERRQRVAQLLEYVGLPRRASHRVTKLSGGEMQRVAIARAIANRPTLLLADEPTGELDVRTGQEILALFRDLNRDGTTIVVVTHDDHLAAEASRVIKLSDGLVVSDSDSDRVSEVGTP